MFSCQNVLSVIGQYLKSWALSLGSKSLLTTLAPHNILNINNIIFPTKLSIVHIIHVYI